jgi:hypothetical protein
MKARYKLIRRRGIYYCEDSKTRHEWCLHTPDRQMARRILQAIWESEQMPFVSSAIAHAYMAAATSMVHENTWSDVLDLLLAEKNESPSKWRWELVRSHASLKPLWRLKVMHTRADQLFTLLREGTQATNLYLRRLHDYALDVHWLPWPILSKKCWTMALARMRRTQLLARNSKGLTPDAAQQICSSEESRESLKPTQSGDRL